MVDKLRKTLDIAINTSGNLSKIENFRKVSQTILDNVLEGNEAYERTNKIMEEQIGKAKKLSDFTQSVLGDQAVEQLKAVFSADTSAQDQLRTALQVGFGLLSASTLKGVALQLKQNKNIDEIKKQDKDYYQSIKESLGRSLAMTAPPPSTSFPIDVSPGKSAVNERFKKRNEPRNIPPIAQNPLGEGGRFMDMLKGVGRGAGKIAKGIAFDAPKQLSGIPALKKIGKAGMGGVDFLDEKLPGIGKGIDNVKEKLAEAKKFVDEKAKAFKKMSLVATGALAFIVASSPGLTAQLTVIKLQFKLIAMELGEKLQPLFERVAEIIKDLTDKFLSLDEGTQQFIAFTILAVAGIGVLIPIITTAISIFGVLGTIISVVTTVIGFLGGALAGAFLPILLIAGAITALILIFKNWDAITEKIGEVFNKLPTPLQKVGKAIWDTLFLPVRAVIGIFKGLYDAIVFAFSALKEGKGLKGMGSRFLKGFLDPFIGTIRSAYDNLGFDFLKKVIDFYDNVESYAIGTDFVPQDQLAMVHRGEMIIPAKQAERIRSGNNGAGFSGMGMGSTVTISPTINLTVTGTGNDEAIARRASDMAVRELERLISRI